MAISTHAELLTAIQNYFDDTSTIVSDRDDEWVTLAENRIHFGAGLPGDRFYSPPLRVRQMENRFTIRVEANQAGGTSGGSANVQTLTMTSVTEALGLTISFTAGFTNTGAITLQPTGGSAVAIRKGVNNDALEAADIVLGASYTVYYDGTFYKLMSGPGAVPLPARFLGFKTIYNDATNDRPLEYFSSQHMSGLAGVNSAGILRGYTIDGDNIRLISLPEGTSFLNGIYYRRFSALSTELNELFRMVPSVYLYGALMEGCIYTGDDEDALKYFNLYSGACKGFAAANRNDRLGAGPLTMRVPLVV